MPDYIAYFLNGSSAVVRLDTIIISHPNMSQDYALVRNNRAGLTATLETAQSQDFQWYPFGLNDSEVVQSLDYGLEIILGDLGEILPGEIDNIRAANAMNIPPTVTFRAYTSDDLTAPVIGPIELEMVNPTVEQRGTTFVAQPKEANRSATGEIYSFSRFPMLRGTQ